MSYEIRSDVDLESACEHAKHAKHCHDDSTYCVFPQLDKNYICDAEPIIRRQFAAKVLGQVFVMLLEVACICVLGMRSSPHTQKYLLGQGAWIMWSAVIVSFAVLLSFFCHPSLMYHVPQKYIVLGVFGASNGVLCMYATMQYTTASVLMVTGLTASVTLVLCIYAATTKRDFTTMGGALYTFLWLLIAFGILQIWFHDRILQLLVASGGALLFSFYLIYDLQLVLGGKHRKYQHSLDDDVLASIGIFLDIINLFLDLLSLFGNRR